MLTSDEFAPQTSAPSSSATRVSSACAPDSATPSPMMTIGRVAPASMRRRLGATASALGATRVSGNDVGTTVLVVRRVEHVHRQRDEDRAHRRRGGDLDRPPQHAQQRASGRRRASPTWSPARAIDDEVGGHLGVHRVVADARLAGDHDERRVAALGLVHHADAVAEADAAVELDDASAAASRGRSRRAIATAIVSCRVRM